ncbi:MAG TPA: heavy-metal-associated domain-containing protein [Acetobacteraceae bacterium]|nr:heavy-metal-associated domain-containing protein [Rhodocyclaceae bacterium]HUZ65151.1 heavy-metal-associated domain-containing protein [Acetobacteraceae bacterium]
MPRSIRAVAFAVGLFAAPLAARAADTSVVLDVHHAGCVLCGPIVKSTLAHVKGVSAVQVSQPNGAADVTATVTYNTATTSPAALIKAVTDQGYPAELAKPSHG